MLQMEDQCFRGKLWEINMVQMWLHQENIQKQSKFMVLVWQSSFSNYILPASQWLHFRAIQSVSLQQKNINSKEWS